MHVSHHDIVQDMAAGIELGRFRLRAGCEERALRQAYRAMVEQHLRHQPGWRGQRLVRLEDGSFIDLAFAADAAQAKAICASWQGQAACDAFLALIEPVGMEFGGVVEHCL